VKQARRHLRTLRVTDDHEPMVLRELRAIDRERGGDVGVRDLEELVLIALRREVGRDRRLAIERRVDVADLAEPGNLRCRCGANLRQVREVDMVAGQEAEVDGSLEVRGCSLRLVEQAAITTRKNQLATACTVADPRVIVDVASAHSPQRDRGLQTFRP